jgi:cell wall-associated NlpC family hydrolase
VDRSALIKLALSKLGTPYLFGGKWPLNSDDTGSQGIDCSGFVRWCYARSNNIILPDGSYSQYDASDPCDDPLPGDVAFFRNADSGDIDHVGMVANDEYMVEARGKPFNQVILRPRAKWEAWPEFTGYRRFKVLG